MEYLFRFLAGGIVVSTFAVLGDVLRPKSFAGLTWSPTPRCSAKARRLKIRVRRRTPEARGLRPRMTTRRQ